MAFDVDVKVFVDALGPAAATALAEAGANEKSEVETEQAGRRGIQPLTHIAVDGRQVTDFTSVKPTSIIFEYWDYRAEIIKAAFEGLQARSPTLTGKYRNSFYCILDDAPQGALVVPQPAQLENVQRIIITNDVPYARRLEVGRTEGGSSFVKQVDPRIVESTMRELRNEFGAVATITFNWVDLGTPAAASWLATRSRKLGGKKARTSSLRYPAIFIDQA